MSYEGNLKETMLDVLNDRMSGIANCIIVLQEEGYLPNRKKTTILNWSIILSSAYNNINIFTEEQCKQLDVLYNKLLML